MDRYIAKELILPFLFGVGAFSSIGVSVGALFDLIRKVTESGLQVSLAMQIFVLRMPEFIVLAFPMSTLLATMMTFSRFSADSEMTALRSCGISVRRIIAPALALSIFVTGVTFVFNEVITPAANYRAKIMLDRALNSEDLPFKERNILYKEYQSAEDDGLKELGRLFYARRFDGTEMKGLTILDFSQTGLSQIVSADSATWDFQRNLWQFNDGTIYAISPDGSFGHIVKFEEQQLMLPRAPLDLASRNKDDDEMNIAEASEHLKLLRQSGDDPKIRLWELRIQQKYAIPIVCVVFGIVGSAIGIRPHRTGRATSFGISVIIIFGYYIFSFITDAMGKVDILSPFLAAWLPPILGLAVGIGLVMRASK
ncbi:MAG: LptF/LptG family permease [Cyanobacteria bacterium P01_F01_bin.4]